MLRRSNPWPSVVDLFSALMLLAFGGMILLSGLVPHPNGGPGTASPIQVKAHRLMEDAYAKLTKAGMESRIEKCGEDTCIQLSVHFRTSDAAIYLPNEQRGVREACGAIKGALDQMTPSERLAVQLTVEGHTDAQPYKRAATERDRFLGNWRLSAERAAAVLYEFKGCGLDPDTRRYVITAVGKADKDPDPKWPMTPQYYEKHRRTTLRLQVDTRKLELMQKGSKG